MIEVCGQVLGFSGLRVEDLGLSSYRFFVLFAEGCRLQGLGLPAPGNAAARMPTSLDRPSARPLSAICWFRVLGAVLREARAS